MPYIKIDDRKRLDGGDKPGTAGELNYMLTKLVDNYLTEKGELRYSHINEVVGALECAKLELYRRIAAPYEDSKLSRSGDVYTTHPEKT